MTLGLGAFEKISAVEGIRLSGDMKRDLQALDRSQMTAVQRSRFITEKYGKKSIWAPCTMPLPIPTAIPARRFSNTSPVSDRNAPSIALRPWRPAGDSSNRCRPGRLSLRHYTAVHRHIFQDVYRWAGRLRTVRISKGGNIFCYPENIAGELRRVFDELRQVAFLRELKAVPFARGAAHVLAELNAIHAFRDGNGRSQLAFLAVLADSAGHTRSIFRRGLILRRSSRP